MSYACILLLVYVVDITAALLEIYSMLSVAVVSMRIVIDEQEIQQQIQMDAKNVDRLAERAYCRDYNRLGFGSVAAQSRSRTEPFRLTVVNSVYGVCPTYVSLL